MPGCGAQPCMFRGSSDRYCSGADAGPLPSAAHRRHGSGTECGGARPQPRVAGAAAVQPCVAHRVGQERAHSYSDAPPKAPRAPHLLNCTGLARRPEHCVCLSAVPAPALQAPQYGARRQPTNPVGVGHTTEACQQAKRLQWCTMLLVLHLTTHTLLTAEQRGVCTYTLRGHATPSSAHQNPNQGTQVTGQPTNKQQGHAKLGASQAWTPLEPPPRALSLRGPAARRPVAQTCRPSKARRSPSTRPAVAAGPVHQQEGRLQRWRRLRWRPSTLATAFAHPATT